MYCIWFIGQGPWSDVPNRRDAGTGCAGSCGSLGDESFCLYEMLKFEVKLFGCFQTVQMMIYYLYTCRTTYIDWGVRLHDRPPLQYQPVPLRLTGCTELLHACLVSSDCSTSLALAWLEKSCSFLRHQTQRLPSFLLCRPFFSMLMHVFRIQKLEKSVILCNHTSFNKTATSSAEKGSALFFLLHAHHLLTLLSRCVH